jgi:pimeloyl-ACP methyl ester carboxylesterase
MPKLDRNGVQIHYEVHGKGPVILLTHGYSATSQMWRGQIEPLTKSHTLVIWDMRGHGQSDYPADPGQYSAALTVADMRALLDTVGAKTAVVGGLSLGGYMSLAFHLAHPERVRALMLFDTGPGFKKDDAREAWNKRAAETAREYDTEGLARLQRLSKEMATAKHRSADGLAGAARGMLAQSNASIINSLPTVAVPTLIVVGANDKPFLAATDYMAAKIAGAQKVVIPDAGHSANLDQPETFNCAVVAFLDRLAG